jgi:hypothetical protein
MPVDQVRLNAPNQPLGTAWWLSQHNRWHLQMITKKYDIGCICQKAKRKERLRDVQLGALINGSKIEGLVHSATMRLLSDAVALVCYRTNKNDALWCIEVLDQGLEI